MAISVGDKVPSATLYQKTADGIEAVATDEYFGGKKVVLFAVPGAFTPTCSATHLPGFVANAAALRDKGVDAIACVAVNDAFVMGAWAESQGVGGAVDMLADGSGELAKAMGMELDLTERGLGVRAQRYAMIVDDGTVTDVQVEASPGEVDLTSAENVLSKL